MTRSPADPLLRFRPEFPILETSTYLISNSLGAMPGGAAWIRMSPHFDTRDEELDDAFAAPDEILEARAMKWLGRGSVVT